MKNILRKYNFLRKIVLRILYNSMTKEKKNISEKVISIRVPEVLFNKFKELCDTNYETMSNHLRSYINKMIKENQ